MDIRKISVFVEVELIEEMKNNPKDLCDGHAAFFGLVNFLIGQEHMRKQFKTDTGIDLSIFVNRSGLDKAIDESTGAERKAMIGFCDWVAKNYWGIEE